MTLIRAIAFLLHFTLVPVAIGRLITYRQEPNNRDSAVATYILGLFGSFGIFYVFCALLEWHQYWNTFTEPFTGCFTALCIVYSLVIGILVIRWIIKDFQAIKSFKEYITGRVKSVIDTFKSNRFTLIYSLIFLVLLMVQLYFAYGYEINEWSYDDYDYVVNSQDTIDTDTIAYVNYINGTAPFTSDKRAVTAWPTYIAYLAKISGFEVATVCHTILPVILLLIAYLVIYYIAEYLLKNTENRMVFMTLAAVLYIFGSYSHYSPSFRLLGALWQGKAVLSVIAIPFFIFYLIRNYDIPKKGTCIPTALFSLGACSLTTMSALLITVAAVGTWICLSIYKRKIQSIRYFISSMIGVLFLIVFYILMSMLIHDMTNTENNYFIRGRDINWWYKWFG